MKFLSKILLIFIVCSLALSFSGCNKHKHSYETTVVEPSCTEGGFTLYFCECGYSYKDNFVDAKGHNYVDHYCSVCSEVQLPSSLEDLVFFYEEEMIATAKRVSGNMTDMFTYNFEVCILDKIETVQYIQAYEITPEISPSQVERGLFVKCETIWKDTQLIAYTTFFNFGLQLNCAYEKLEVSVMWGTPSAVFSESWALFPLVENEYVYFEFAVIGV